MFVTFRLMGYAAAYGMGTEEAVKAVTINPAEILVYPINLVHLKLKQANLFIGTGDPFEHLAKLSRSL